jgi:hypothetical protein
MDELPAAKAECPATQNPSANADVLASLDPVAALVRRLFEPDLAETVFGVPNSVCGEDWARIAADESVMRAARELIEQIRRRRRGEAPVQPYVFEIFEVETPLADDAGLESASADDAIIIDVDEMPAPQNPSLAPLESSPANATMPPPNLPPAGREHPGAVPQNRAPSPPPPPKARFGVEKNARAGEAFDALLAVECLHTVDILEVSLAEGLGLSYDPQTRRLTGIPAIAGEHALKIGYRFTGLDSGPARLEAECALIVNPDPRSLWKDLPSDREAEDWKPDEARQALAGADGLRLVAASRRGRSHAHVGGFREDDFFLHASEGWHILAVADGAGSAERSRRGSRIAAERAGAWLTQALAGEPGRELRAAAERPEDGALKNLLYRLLGGAAFEALKAIEEEAALKGKPAKDYASTLILGLHGKIPAGHLFAVYWIGDGAAAVYRRGHGVEPMGEADSGEFAGQTRFLDRAALVSGEEIMKRLKFLIAPDFTAFALMTDGVGDPKFGADRNQENTEYWNALWDEWSPLLDDAEPDARLLEWLKFWSVGNHDDRTLALLYPAPVAASAQTSSEPSESGAVPGTGVIDAYEFD